MRDFLKPLLRVCISVQQNCELKSLDGSSYRFIVVGSPLSPVFHEYVAVDKLLTFLSFLKVSFKSEVPPLCLSKDFYPSNQISILFFLTLCQLGHTFLSQPSLIFSLQYNNINQIKSIFFKMVKDCFKYSCSKINSTL